MGVFSKVRARYRASIQSASFEARGFHVPNDVTLALDANHDPRSSSHPLASIWLMTPVDQAPFHFRLVYIEPAKEDDDTLHIKIGGATISQSSGEPTFKTCTKQYHAISYTWSGEPRDHRVFCFGKPVPVTKSCFDILCAVRRQVGSTLIWIDQLCINQLETSWGLQERSRQIQMMGEIYAGAKSVIVWLERPALSGARLMHALSLMEHLADKQKIAVDGVPVSFSRSTSDWACLFDLLENRYFGRRWILQEVAADSPVYALFDHRSYGFSKLLHCGMFLLRLQAEEITLDRALSDELKEGLVDITSRSATLHNLALTATLATSRMMKSSENTMFELLLTHHRYESERQHDAIYALRSLASDRGKLPLPDYEKSYEKVCLEHSIFFWNEGYSSQLLLYSGSRQPDSLSLPSWALDPSPGFLASTVGQCCPRDLSQQKHCHQPIQAASREIQLSRKNIGHIRATSGKYKRTLEDQLRHLQRFASENTPEGLLLGRLLAYVNLLSESGRDWKNHTLSSQFRGAMNNVDASLRLLATAPRFPGEIKHMIRHHLLNSDDSSVVKNSATLAITTDGRLGLVPEWTEPGDSLVFLEGVPMPSILRKTDRSECYCLIGTCYFLDAQDLRLEESGWEPITLV